VDEHNWLARRFEAHRARVRAVAYRMLGSLSEVDYAVQVAWFRLGARTAATSRISARGAPGRDPERE